MAKLFSRKIMILVSKHFKGRLYSGIQNSKMVLMMSELNLQDVQSYKVTHHDFVMLPNYVKRTQDRSSFFYYEMLPVETFDEIALF